MLAKMPHSKIMAELLTIVLESCAYSISNAHLCLASKGLTSCRTGSCKNWSGHSAG